MPGQPSLEGDGGEDIRKRRMLWQSACTFLNDFDLIDVFCKWFVAYVGYQKALVLIL
jgi:hypothetical protein